MKQSKRLQPAAEKAVVAAGCDYKSVETDASEATKCRRTSVPSRRLAPQPLSAGATSSAIRRRALPVAASCLQPPRPGKLVVASRPRSESKECRIAALPWFTRAGEVGQLNQADSHSLRSLRKQLRIKTKSVLAGCEQTSCKFCDICNFFC